MCGVIGIWCVPCGFVCLLGHMHAILLLAMLGAMSVTSADAVLVATHAHWGCTATYADIHYIHVRAGIHQHPCLLLCNAFSYIKCIHVFVYVCGGEVCVEWLLVH